LTVMLYNFAFLKKIGYQNYWIEPRATNIQPLSYIPCFYR